MADHDGDSRMASSPSPPASDDGLNEGGTSILSPPGSQQQAPPSAMSTSTAAVPSPTGSANANGKRPIQTISNGAESKHGETIEDPIDIESASSTTAMPPTPGATGGNMSGKQQAKQDFAPRVHQPSGYTWSREEDQPGYAWNSSKAIGEANKAWEGMVHRELMVKNRYGDPFEMADREQAVLNSLKQR